MIDPSVLHLEIQNILKQTPTNSEYFYEACGISTFLFSKLSSFQFYKIHKRDITDFELQKQNQDEFLKVWQSMIMLYFTVGPIQYPNVMGLDISNKITPLLSAILSHYTSDNVAIFPKTLNCIFELKKYFYQQVTGKSMIFYNYFRCYLLPISIYYLDYIHKLYDKIISGTYKKSSNMPVFESLQGFYELSTFLNLN